jgi:hypothetical protein
LLRGKNQHRQFFYCTAATGRQHTVYRKRPLPLSRPLPCSAHTGRYHGSSRLHTWPRNSMPPKSLSHSSTRSGRPSSRDSRGNSSLHAWVAEQGLHGSLSRTPAFLHGRVWWHTCRPPACMPTSQPQQPAACADACSPLLPHGPPVSVDDTCLLHIGTQRNARKPGRRNVSVASGLEVPTRWRRG